MGAYRIAIIVRGTGNYNGAASKTRYLKIQQEQIKEEDIKITIPTDLEYDGNPKQISVEIIMVKQQITQSNILEITQQTEKLLMLVNIQQL